MIVDDATHEAVAIDVEGAISGHGIVRVLDRLPHSRGLSKMIRTDNGKECCGKAMVAWAHDRGVQPSSSRRANRTRTATSNRSTAGCATNASTNTGSQRYCMQARK
ncbi:IS1389 transposase [Xanthomonas oryzae pv. oryzae KACC 10331]|uniref:IS1389 transposase n=2 Tax=Xanthomonas oryzae pv. oryzae TaxID=64187 RepID=Q5GXX6_XANOR|nr:IS1389 transposase [Xanthomonas oryzae pv. oryzae KACC 10331]ACD60001.1 transposase [Xanthomonas oryzae pv. oryzae PXO99A]